MVLGARLSFWTKIIKVFSVAGSGNPHSSIDTVSTTYVDCKSVADDVKLGYSISGIFSAQISWTDGSS